LKKHPVLPREPIEDRVKAIAAVEDLDLRNVPDLCLLALPRVDRDSHRMRAKRVPYERVAVIVRSHLSFYLQPEIDDDCVGFLSLQNALRFRN
jgi:hypothetical protein